MKIIQRHSDLKLFQPSFSQGKARYSFRAVEFQRRKWWKGGDRFVKLYEVWEPKDDNEFSIVEVE